MNAKFTGRTTDLALLNLAIDEAGWGVDELQMDIFWLADEGEQIFRYQFNGPGIAEQYTFELWFHNFAHINVPNSFELTTVDNIQLTNPSKISNILDRYSRDILIDEICYPSNKLGMKIYGFYSGEQFSNYFIICEKISGCWKKLLAT